MCWGVDELGALIEVGISDGPVTGPSGVHVFPCGGGASVGEEVGDVLSGDGRVFELFDERGECVGWLVPGDPAAAECGVLEDGVVEVVGNGGGVGCGGVVIGDNGAVWGVEDDVAGH